MLDLPILLIVFNRPDTTKRVFDAIRLACPSKLYIAADGPRKGNNEDKAKCNQVREIATNVDWDCEVKTLFRDENLGCCHAPYGAIDWFFSHEPEGIILEDDCFPHRDFFTYCQWALETYREDDRVWHVNGNNFQVPVGVLGDRTIAFSALAQVWGWATWRKYWKRNQNNPFYLMRGLRQKARKWPLSPIAKINKIHHVVLLQKGLDAWDYQWQITVLNNDGLCVSCSSNLISNIGDGEAATHTPNDTRAHLSVSGIQRKLKYTEPELDVELTRWYARKMGLSSFRMFSKALIYRTGKKVKRVMADTLASILYVGVQPIVIGSTGRSGSTMLLDTVTEGLVFSRFKLGSSSLLGRALIKHGQMYIDRLSDVTSSSRPVNKTHGLLPENVPANVKYIFIYGDPLESALSVQRMTDLLGKIWFEEHLYHLEAQGSYIDLFEKDILNYEKQVQHWTENPSGSVYCVRFDQVWSKLDEIQDFLGFKISLPEKTERNQKAPPGKLNIELFDHLRSLYLK